MDNNITFTFDQLLTLLHREDVTRIAHPTPPAEGTPEDVGFNSRYVVVRGDRSGVFCGIIVSEEGQTVELIDCRHIWYWRGAANTAALARDGVSRPAECKFLPPVGRLRVLDAIEVIDCTESAEKSLRAVSEWVVK